LFPTEKEKSDMSNEIEMMPLNKLVASPHNVSKTRSQEGMNFKPRVYFTVCWKT
jgi:hypothetical protein